MPNDENHDAPETTIPGTQPRSRGVCGPFDVQFLAPDNLDWAGSNRRTDVRDGPVIGGGTNPGGRFEWHTKLVAGYWPVVHSINVYANPNAQPAPAVGITFGFANPEDILAGTAQASPVRHIIFSGTLPVPTGVPAPVGTPQPSALNSNFGAGWLVPSWNGLPMAFFIDSAKTMQSVGLTASLFWSWVRMETIR